MSTQTINSKDLTYQYNWFQNTFPPVVQEVFDDFFATDCSFTMFGLCKNLNTLADKDSYFVTKIKIDKQHDMFFRMSESAIGLILDNVLGKAFNKIDLNKLTQLETNIITTFNDCLYRSVVQFLKPAPPTLTRVNFDVIYLGFLVTEISSGKTGRFFISLPEVLIEPEEIEPQDVFPVEIFEKSLINVRLEVGKTTFSLYELKNLDVEDIIIFESSNIDKMKLKIKDYEKEVLLKPNLSLVMPIENNGGSEVSENDINIWDSIEVEMVANFDAVGISLGELKKIQSGMVLDLTSIYKNHVTLSVENRPIASGELVIVNDKYGVKITEVYTPVENKVAKTEEIQEEQMYSEDEFSQDDEIETVDETANITEDDDEEFDYSDFDLEEDI